MNDRPHDAPNADDWLEAALRAEGVLHRSGYVDDAGFTVQVMAALPVPVALPAWRRPALMVLWAAAGLGIAYALPGAVFDVAHDILRIVIGQSVAPTGIGLGVTALGAATWAAAAVALRND